MRVSPRNVLLAVTSAVVIYTLASHSRLHQGAATGENLLSSPVRSIPQNGMDTSAFTPWEAGRERRLYLPLYSTSCSGSGFSRPRPLPTVRRRAEPIVHLVGKYPKEQLLEQGTTAVSSPYLYPHTQT